MNLYKRPEKETDPQKYPGQVVYRYWWEGIQVQEPSHFEKPLVKEIEEYQLGCQKWLHGTTCQCVQSERYECPNWRG